MYQDLIESVHVAAVRSWNEDDEMWDDTIVAVDDIAEGVLVIGTKTQSLSLSPKGLHNQGEDHRFMSVMDNGEA
jgi:hypothetical protein